MVKLSIVIPCFNEEKTIQPFLKVTKQVEKEMQPVEFEYIFIDDGSKDNTLAVLETVVSEYSNIYYLSFSRNFGKEAALLAGLEHASGDLVTVMDADLQDPPELLLEMYQKIQVGYDVVGTRRQDRNGEPLIRSFFSKMFYILINTISDTEMVAGARDFRLMTRQVVDSILELREVNRFSKGLFSWVGYKTMYISFENRERIAGETSWSFLSLFKYSLEGFINFSDILLSLATFGGFISFGLSLLGITFIIVRKLFLGGSVEGWPSLVCLVLFMGGLQLLALGILGKYVSKIFMETKNRPAYIVRQKGGYDRYGGER